MMCTAFAGCSIVSMLEARETGNRRTFSPLELYTRANGSSVGNTVQNTVNALAGGLVEEKDCPWISPVSDWDPFVLRLMGEYAKARSGDRLDPSVAVKSATYVTPTHDAIREALKDSPVLAIVPVGRGYFDDPAPYTASGSAHAVVITKVADDGKIMSSIP